VAPYVCSLHALLARSAYPLVPRVNGSLPRLCSDLLRILYSASFGLPSLFAPSCPSSLLSSSPPCPFFVFCLLRTTICLTSFVRSFVLLLAESIPAFRRLQCAIAPLFSSPSPSPFPFALPFPPPPARSSLFRGSSLPRSNPARFHG